MPPRRLALVVIAAAASLRLALACTSFDSDRDTREVPTEAGGPMLADGSTALDGGPAALDDAGADADADAADAGFCETRDAQFCDDFEGANKGLQWSRTDIQPPDGGTTSYVAGFGHDSQTSSHAVAAPGSCVSAQLGRKLTVSGVTSVSFGFDAWLGDRNGSMDFPDSKFNHFARLSVESGAAKTCHLLVAAHANECGLWVQDTTVNPAPQDIKKGFTSLPNLFGRWIRFHVTASFTTREVTIDVDGKRCVTHTAENCLFDPPTSLTYLIGPYCTNALAGTVIETFHDNAWLSTF